MAESISNLPGEVWKPVVGWEGLYEVSNRGRVKRLERNHIRAVPSRQRLHYPEKLMRPSPRRGAPMPYLWIMLSCKERRVSYAVNVLVLEAFICAKPKGMQTRHLDNDPRNNHLENLASGTAKENAADRVAHGTHPDCERNGNAKLTPEQVAYIRSSKKTGSALARELGMAPTGICRIKRGDSWKTAECRKAMGI